MNAHQWCRIIGILFLGIMIGSAVNPHQRMAWCEEPSESIPPPMIPETFLLPEESRRPDPETLTPGLSVSYLSKKLRHIEEIPDAGTGWSAGKPLKQLNHRFDGQEPVFDSGVAREVAMRIEGYLHFTRHGNVEMRVKSNDGIRVWISGIQTIDDPEVHSDRFSLPVTLVVPKPGYYPVKILYFQRKGSACLEMYWKEPGSPDFSVIPEEAYFHFSQSEKP